MDFSLIVHEKSLNIPDDKEEDFDDNINFYIQCLLLIKNTEYKILKDQFGGKKVYY